MLFYFFFVFHFFFSILFFIFSLYMYMYNMSLFLSWLFLNINSVNFEIYIYMDWISLMFAFLVMFISSMIFMYCVQYMSMDYKINRFFYLIFFFVLSMMLMIFSPNIFSILFGWDGLGLISYCLIVFYQSVNSYNSGMLTVLINRIGDVMIIISIMFFMIKGSFNFLNLNFYNFFVLFILVIASFTKSAQIPFSSWLPAAMAAPTPVSSLVHSSTLVTAGVYLMIRFFNLIVLNKNLMNFIMIIGLMTMFFAGLSASFEFDLKKIIAFSTLSQLGLMMMIFGGGLYILSFFHLIIHALFKSMMFMCSGVIIHSLNNFQDIRYMGFLFNFMPFTMIIFCVSNFSLCGLPFFSGFFSKDLILEKFFLMKLNLFIFIFLLISTFFTMFYSFRLFYYLCKNEFNYLSFFMINDFFLMNFSMFFLFFFTVFFGFYLNWLIFFNISDVYLMFFEKNFVNFLFLLFIFVLNFKFYNFIINNSFSLFFGKMWFSYYLFFYLKIYLLLNLKSYYILFDKGLLNYLNNNLFFYNFLKLSMLKIYQINNLNLFILNVFFFFLMFVIL